MVVDLEHRNLLDNEVALEAISQLPHVLRIRLADIIKGGESPSPSSGFRIDRGGKSGAVIVYAYVEPDADAAWEAGYYYIKINPSERDQINEARIERLNHLKTKSLLGIVPVVELTIYNNCLVEMTGSALQNASTDHTVQRLTDLLKSRTNLTRRYVDGLSDIMLDWAKNTQENAYNLEQIFLLMFEDGRLRKHPTRNILYRAQILFKQLRLAKPAEENKIPIKLESLGYSSKLIFGDYAPLPNPIAYINHPQWWAEGEQIPFLSGFSHQDLHCDNIMCNLHPENNEGILYPDIIDVTDYKPIHPVFWDFLYLEFDLLNRAGQPYKQENRKELWNLVSILMRNDLDSPLNYDGPFLFQPIYECIKIIRSKALSLLQSLDPESRRKYKRAFWTVATGVGLNYMRKSSVNIFSRLLGLFYAANAFHHVVEEERLESTVGNIDTLYIPHWTGLVEKPIPTEIDGYISDVLSSYLSANSPIVICLSPEFNRINGEKLRDEIKLRLSWWPSNADLNGGGSIPEAMQTYSNLTSDLNLATLIRRLSCTQNETHDIFLNQLNALCERLPNITLVTTAWHEPLLPEPDPDNPLEHKPIIYLCGHTNLPDSLCTLQEWTSEPDKAFLQRENERLRSLLLNKQSRVIFFGSQPLDEPNWHSIFGHVHADYINKTTPAAQLLDNYEPYKFAPEDFIKQLYEAYEKQPIAEAHQAALQSLENYVPPNIVHHNLQEEIIHHPARLWMVYDLAWKGKSTFLKMLSKQHAAWYPPNNIRKGLLIDFDLYPSLRAQKRALVALLLDHYHMDYPHDGNDIKQSDDEKLLHLIRILENTATFDEYPDKWLLCFDGLVQDDPYLLDWLREELAPALAKRGVTVVFALRTFPVHLHIDPKQNYLAKWNKLYKTRSLEWINPREVKSRILNFICTVNWEKNHHACLQKNLEGWTYRQAIEYQRLGRGTMMIVDSLFHRHMNQTEAELYLGIWPQAEQQWQIEQEVVYETIWKQIKTELRLDMLRDSSTPRWQTQYERFETLLMTEENLVEDFYRELLCCRRISGELIHRWSKFREIPLPKFLPTMLSELQSLAYIHHDDRPLRMGVPHYIYKQPIYFVLEIIYTTMQRHFYYKEIVCAKKQDVKSSILYQLMDVALFYSQELAQEARDARQGELLMSYVVDVIYYASILYALDHEAAKPKTQLMEYLPRLEVLGISPAKLRAELETITLAWQIDDVRDILERVIDLI
jgi:hypothetical protein